jgi:FkbM family methyltransferase
MKRRKKAIRKLRRNIRVLGAGIALRLLGYELLGIRREVDISIDGVDIRIRSSTSDLAVAISGLYSGEYGDIACESAETIIDAGANIGSSAIAFARRFPGAKIFALEPELSNFLLLKHNVRLYPNIVPLHAALWGDSGTRSIYDRNTGNWGFTLVGCKDLSAQTAQTIECVTIDGLIKKYGIGTIDILKMDIEGSERSVLEGSAEWIDKVQVIVVELHDRIVEGCSRAFYLATKDFERFKKKGEKIAAYRR